MYYTYVHIQAIPTYGVYRLYDSNQVELSGQGWNVASS